MVPFSQQQVAYSSMGKTKRCYSSFIADCKHPMETMCKSGGFGSSSRMEVDMANFEDSRDRKRKCISLNVDKCDSFNVPLQIHSPSKMSRSQRKELELKLRSELEQVLNYQKKLLLRYPHEITVSHSNDILSCKAEKKRPKHEISHEQAKLFTMLSKKQATLQKNTNPKCQSSQLEKRKELQVSQSANPKKLKKPERLMTIQEKMDLGRDLEQLKGELQEEVIDFLRKCSSNPSNEAEIEVDIETLGDERLFTLRKLLDDSMIKQSQEESKACKIALLKEPLFRNSSLQHPKVKDPVNEDVDIDVNDDLVPSYPPLEIEKDATLRISSCISSSRDSDSSSSLCLFFYYIGSFCTQLSYILNGTDCCRQVQKCYLLK